MPRVAPRHFEYGSPNDRLDAAERGLEWGAALLKARASARSAHRLRCLLSGVDASVGVGTSGGQGSGTSVSLDQESLFERLRLAIAGVETRWDCTVEGAGSRMRVWLAEPSTKHVVWSQSGSSTQVLAAFNKWLSMRR